MLNFMFSEDINVLFMDNLMYILTVHSFSILVGRNEPLPNLSVF